MRRMSATEKLQPPSTSEVPSAFPTSLAIAATWDTALAAREARAIAHEALALGRDQVLGPDLQSYGEDPFLASRMGVAYVGAVQGEGIIATLKTFPTGMRGSMDERTLQEIAWPPFRAAIEEAGAWSVLADDADAPAVRDVLRNGWGFKGFLFSQGAPAGDELRRTLLAMFAMGTFEREHRTNNTIDPAERAEAVHAIADESAVLLKNAGPILPLAANNVHSIAVIGASGLPGIRERPGTMIQARFASGDNPAEAADLARKSDAAIVCIADNTHDALIETVARANPKTIVVLTAGPVGNWKKWIDRVSALVCVWLPDGVAGILFGDVTPSGKLPVNPIGYGLSYTTFTYSGLRIFPATPRYGQLVQVVFTVQNSGTRKGAEVAQVYVHQRKPSLERFPNELRGFRRVDLKPGETGTVSLTLDRRSMWFYDPAVHDWATEPGVYDVLIGSSSSDIRLKGSFELFQ